MDPAQTAAPTVYKKQEIMMDMRRPKNSLQGLRIKAPPTAPSGMAELTRLSSRVLRPRSVGRNRLAPEMSDWSRPESMPPIEAKAMIIQLKYFVLLNCRSKKPFLSPPSASSSRSRLDIRLFISPSPPLRANSSASFSLSAFSAGPPLVVSTWSPPTAPLALSPELGRAGCISAIVSWFFWLCCCVAVVWLLSLLPLLPLKGMRARAGWAVEKKGPGGKHGRWVSTLDLQDERSTENFQTRWERVLEALYGNRRPSVVDRKPSSAGRPWRTAFGRPSLQVIIFVDRGIFFRVTTVTLEPLVIGGRLFFFFFPPRVPNITSSTPCGFVRQVANSVG